MKPRRADLIVPLLAALVVGAAAGGARAAPRLSVEITAITFIQPAAPASTLMRALLHVEAQPSLGPAVLRLTLDPGVLVDRTGPTLWSWGVTEVFLQYRRGLIDLRAGVERLPLETARLMIPVMVEPVDILGTRLGRTGLRLIWTPDPATRIRGALLEDAGGVRPALSIRRQFPSFELEAHALTLPGGRAAFGVGGSGLAGNLVVYGEVWTLTAPTETRYALGISGSIPNGLWMLEAGYASPAAVGQVIADGGVRPQVAGQIAYRVSEGWSVTGTGRILADPDALRSQLTVQLTRTVGNTDWTASLTTLLGPEPRREILTAGFTYAF